jgi:hypothetical protein
MGYRAIYIGRSVNREPLDPTDLSNGVDWISMAVGESLSKQADKSARGFPASQGAWPVLMVTIAHSKPSTIA